jgi:serine/threonine-protein kinase
VALKLLRQELSRSPDGRRLFLNEMTILANLDHPNIVRCLACSETDGQLVMTLEYLEGQTLRQLLTDRAPLVWSEAVGVAVQVASALDAAHRQDPPIVHRDLKPENIMVLPGGKVKVMDFGIAKVLQAISKTTTQSVGTLQYMSPEQIDAAGVDARSDLYCLGLVLYEMLAGRPPFDSASPRELLNMQCTEPPPPLSAEVRAHLPRGVERLFLQLLEKSPEDRPGSAREVLTALDPFAPAEAVGANGPVDRATGAEAESSSKVTPVERTHSSSQGAIEDGRRSRGPKPPVKDTIALLEQARRSRDVPPRVAWLAVLGLSIAAGVITYYVRGQAAAPDPPGSAAGGERD